MIEHNIIFFLNHDECKYWRGLYSIIFSQTQVWQSQLAPPSLWVGSFVKSQALLYASSILIQFSNYPPSSAINQDNCPIHMFSLISFAKSSTNAQIISLASSKYNELSLTKTNSSLDCLLFDCQVWFKNCIFHPKHTFLLYSCSVHFCFLCNSLNFYKVNYVF